MGPKGIAAMATAMTAVTGTAFAATATPHAQWDHLWDHVLIDLLIIGVVFGFAALWMMFRFRATSPDQVGRGPRLTKAQAIGWALIPAAIFMADDFYLAAKGWSLFSVYRAPPADSMEIKVTAYQWYFEYDYGNGVVTQELKIPVGKPVVLRMTSPDVIHAVQLAEYRVKEDVMPGRVSFLWFVADKPAKSVVTCTMYCGMAHSRMFSEMAAVPAAEFHAWMEAQVKHATAAADSSKG
jgi:cytochrome c oxidase subunit 2